MEKLSQKDAVYEAITSCQDEHGSFDRKEVIEYIVGLYNQGRFSIDSPKKNATDKLRREYINSLISNWMSKDPRLSGGTVSTMARSGGGKKKKPADDEMKRLAKAKVILLSEGKNTEEIDALIVQRQEELDLAKKNKKQEAEENARRLIGDSGSPTLSNEEHYENLPDCDSGGAYDYLDGLEC